MPGNMSETAPAPAPAKPPRKLAVFGALALLAAQAGWATNGGMLLNIVFGGLFMLALAVTMVREIRKLRPRGMTFAAALYLICWFTVISTLLWRPLWAELAAWLITTATGK